jgi:nitric oxide dioxygenase
MHISEKTLGICKLTAPVLTKHSHSVMKKLYENLYAMYPESKALFGGNKEERDSQFKDAIEHYAKSIDTIYLNNMIQPKDRTLYHEYATQIKASLIQAIKDVFGDAANDDVIQAWEESYMYLDNIVILKESDLSASA